MTLTPWMSANASSLRFCITSLAELVPNGILRNRFHPNGVWNVQRYGDSSDNLTSVFYVDHRNDLHAAQSDLYV